jgi:predicted NBD/HSP70 family sugar kinase
MTQFAGPQLGRLTAPRMSARVSEEESASVLARLIASGTAETRADLVRETGLARSTVGIGLGALFNIGLLSARGYQHPTGRGRPGERLSIEPTFGVIAAVEIDMQRTTIAIYDFGQHQHAAAELETRLTHHPGDVVADIAATVHALIDGLAQPLQLRSAVIGVAAPVDVRRATVVGPPFLAEWDNFPLGAALAEALGCAATVRNDADLRALGEARHMPAENSPLVYLRISDGVGTGYVDAAAEIVTGFDGAAGEISHMRTVTREGRVCTCGGTDHLQSYGSEPAMLAKWRSSHPDRIQATRADFERQLRRRDIEATRFAIEAAREIGAALAEILLVLNPAHITIGGDVLDASDTIMSTIRGVIYETGLPLATRNLSISQSPLGEEAGLRGALLLALEISLAAPALRQHLAARRHDAEGLA